MLVSKTMRLACLRLVPIGRKILALVLGVLLLSLPFGCFLLACAPANAQVSTGEHSCCPSKQGQNRRLPTERCDECPFSYAALKHGVIKDGHIQLPPAHVFIPHSVSIFAKTPDFSSLTSPWILDVPYLGKRTLFIALRRIIV